MLDEPPEAQRLQLLNDVWKVVMKLESPEVTTRLNCSCQFPGTTDCDLRCRRVLCFERQDVSRLAMGSGGIPPWNL